MMTLAPSLSALTLRSPIDDGPKRPQYGPRIEENWYAKESAGVASSENVHITVDLVKLYASESGLTLIAPSMEPEPTWFGIRVITTPNPFGIIGGKAGAPRWHFKRMLEEDDGG